MDVNTSRADLLPEMLAAGARAAARSTTATRVRSGACARRCPPRPAGAGRRGASRPRRARAHRPARASRHSTGPRRAPSRTRPTTRATCASTSAVASATGSSTPARSPRCTRRSPTAWRTFADPDGAPAVAAVVGARELYPGVRADRLPDLVVRWTDRRATARASLRSPRFGEVRRQGSGSGRSGNHTAGDAWALVVPGASAHAEREPGRAPRLVDVAATVCEVDGRGRGWVTRAVAADEGGYGWVGAAVRCGCARSRSRRSAALSTQPRQPLGGHSRSGQPLRGHARARRPRPRPRTPVAPTPRRTPVPPAAGRGRRRDSAPHPRP